MADNVFFPGTRVLVFDPCLYVDDKRTPPNVTMKPATVIRWYGKRSEYFGWTDGNLIDVHFDHNQRLSRAHFTSSVRVI